MTLTGLLVLVVGVLIIASAFVPSVTSRIRELETSRPSYKYWVFGAISIGFLGSVIDHGSTNVALPTIANHFRTDIPTIQWVVIGYTLTITALLLPMGRLADLIGRKKVYIIGSLVYVLGAALAGSSASLGMLIGARLFQGVGAAMTQGTGMAIIISTFPSRERGKAIGLIMTIVGSGAVAGPAIGGLLVDTFGWPFVFFINVPLGLLGIGATLTILQEQRTAQDAARSGDQFDWMGAALSTGALITLLLAMTNGHKSGWTSPPIVVAELGFFALSAAFIWWELHTPSPMLDLRLFARKTFSFGMSAAFLTFMGSSSIFFLMPFYLQGVLGFSAKSAGLILMPGAVFMAVMGPISGALSDRFGPRWFTVGGLASSSAGLFLLARLTEDSSLVTIIPALILTSAGMGTFYSPNSSSVLSAVELERYGIVSALLNLVRNGANIISLAMATAIITATMGSMGFEPSLDAVRGSGGFGAAHAFSVGLRYGFLTMMSLLLIAMAVSAYKEKKADVVGAVAATAAGQISD